jgi:hypothetical protein
MKSTNMLKELPNDERIATQQAMIAAMQPGS